MDLEKLFSAANAMALVAWLLIALLPRRRWTAGLVGPVIVPALLAIAYAVLLFGGLAASDGGFGSLADVKRLFGDDGLLLAGWLHYLAFDLFVGSWEVRDAQRIGVPHLFVLPCLVGTFLFGPLGLALYLLIRAGKRRVAIVDAHA